MASLQPSSELCKLTQWTSCCSIGVEENGAKVVLCVFDPQLTSFVLAPAFSFLNADLQSDEYVKRGSLNMRFHWDPNEQQVTKWFDENPEKVEAFNDEFIKEAKQQSMKVLQAVTIEPEEEEFPVRPLMR